MGAAWVLFGSDHFARLESSSQPDLALTRFKRALQPAITGLELDWQVTDARVFPFHLRPIFHGDACAPPSYPCTAPAVRRWLRQARGSTRHGRW